MKKFNFWTCLGRFPFEASFSFAIFVHVCSLLLFHCWFHCWFHCLFHCLFHCWFHCRFHCCCCSLLLFIVVVHFLVHFLVHFFRSFFVHFLFIFCFFFLFFICCSFFWFIFCSFFFWFIFFVLFFVHFLFFFVFIFLFMFCSFVVHFLFMFCSCLVHVLFMWTQHGDVNCNEGRAQRHDDPIMIGYVLGSQPSWDAIGWREHDGPTDLDADDKERFRLQHKDNGLRAHFRRSPPRRRAGTLPAGRQCSAERPAETPKGGHKSCSCEGVAGLRPATLLHRHGLYCSCPASFLTFGKVSCLGRGEAVPKSTFFFFGEGGEGSEI